MDNPPIVDWPSYVELTFLVLDDSMDELEMIRFLVHHQIRFKSMSSQLILVKLSLF